MNMKKTKVMFKNTLARQQNDMKQNVGGSRRVPISRGKPLVLPHTIIKNSQGKSGAFGKQHDHE